MIAPHLIDAHLSKVCESAVYLDFRWVISPLFLLTPKSIMGNIQIISLVADVFEFCN